MPIELHLWSRVLQRSCRSFGTCAVNFLVRARLQSCSIACDNSVIVHSCLWDIPSLREDNRLVEAWSESQKSTFSWCKLWVMIHVTISLWNRLLLIIWLLYDSREVTSDWDWSTGSVAHLKLRWIKSWCVYRTDWVVFQRVYRTVGDDLIIQLTDLLNLTKAFEPPVWMRRPITTILITPDGQLWNIKTYPNFDARSGQQPLNASAGSVFGTAYIGYKPIICSDIPVVIKRYPGWAW